MKFSLSDFHKFSKIRLKSFSCQNRKSELLIDGLIISGSLQSFDVRKRQNKFCKLSQNWNLGTLLNFTSLCPRGTFFWIFFFLVSLCMGSKSSSLCTYFKFSRKKRMLWARKFVTCDFESWYYSSNYHQSWKTKIF